MASLEGLYRRLLFTYPREYRHDHQAEILTILVEAAAPGQRWPTRRETGGLLVGGLRTHGLLAARKGGRALLADGLRLAVVLLLGLRLVDYTTSLVRLLPPSWAPMPVSVWAAVLLLSLALVATVRGATRGALVLLVFGGVASMPWQLPASLFLRVRVGADPASPDTALIVLAAVLVVVQRRLDRVSRPWSWWVAAAVIFGPMLNVQAQDWYMQYVVTRMDTNYAPYISWALGLVGSLITLAVPSALIALVLLARDPRPSIAVAVAAGASMLATMYSSVVVGIEQHGYAWAWVAGYLIQPGLIVTVSVVITVALMRTGQRLVPR